MAKKPLSPVKAAEKRADSLNFYQLQKLLAGHSLTETERKVFTERLRMYESNPAKFERCVKKVKRKGGANPYAVCTAAGTRGNKARKNPAGEAAEAFEDFHGSPSTETIVVEKQIHYHGHLSAAGELVKLVIISETNGQIVELEDFGGAILAFNEKRTQMYIEGGSQRVDLKSFGISRPHDSQVLGALKVVEYYTTKEHLGNEGGEATYVHKLSRPYPVVTYDTMNEQLLISGGRYKILPEGIDD
jgi:hypothetical protein